MFRAADRWENDEDYFRVKVADCQLKACMKIRDDAKDGKHTLMEPL